MGMMNALMVVVMLAGAAGAAETAKAPAAKPGKKAAAAEKKADWKARTFTAEELKKYNGRDGMPAYVAVDGIVYDLTNSKYWKTGTHMKMHEAGGDLSPDIHNKAPQGIHKDGKILERMAKVGVMAGSVPARAVVRAVKKDEIGREEVCPVTGEKFKVAKETPAADYKGKAYYFCCAGCDSDFAKDPEKYLKKK